MRKNYKFSFVFYQDKFRSLPGFLALIFILLFIVLIPLLFALVIAGGLIFMIFSGITGLLFPSGTKYKDLKEPDFKVKERRNPSLF